MLEIHGVGDGIPIDEFERISVVLVEARFPYMQRIPEYFAAIFARCEKLLASHKKLKAYLAFVPLSFCIFLAARTKSEPGFAGRTDGFIFFWNRVSTVGAWIHEFFLGNE